MKFGNCPRNPPGKFRRKFPGKSLEKSQKKSKQKKIRKNTSWGNPQPPELSRDFSGFPWEFSGFLDFFSYDFPGIFYMNFFFGFSAPLSSRRLVLVLNVTTLYSSSENYLYSSSRYHYSIDRP